MFRGTDNVEGQIFVHIFMPNGDYCVQYPSNIFHSMHSKLLGNITWMWPSLSWVIFSHLMCLDQSRKRNYLMNYKNQQKLVSDIGNL